MSVRRYVIIGNGFAGTTCAEQLRKIDASASIIMFADEPYPLYNRIALPPMLRKQVTEATAPKPPRFDPRRSRRGEMFLEHRVEPRRRVGVERARAQFRRAEVSVQFGFRRQEE